MYLLYVLFIVLCVSAQDTTNCKVYDSLLLTVRQGYKGNYYSARNEIEKVSTNRVIGYYLLLFHDSLTGDSDIPEIEDENAFAFYGMKDAAFSLLNCMNNQLTEGERTFIVEKIINLLYKIHETRPKIVLHILSIFSSLSHSPRIFHLRAESNYYLEKWQDMYEDLVQCLSYNYTDCLTLYWYINTITFQWDKIYQSSLRFLTDEQSTEDKNNKDNEIKILYGTIFYSRSLLALNDSKTGISNLLILLNLHPNNEVLWEVIDDIITSFGVKSFMNAVALISKEIEISPCTRFKLNTYFPITLTNDDDIQINGERIITILNDILNKTEKISNIENCPPTFFDRLSPLLLKDIYIFHPLIKILEYHPLRVDPKEEKFRILNTAIKIAFILQTNVKYYSFPESLQNLIMRLPHDEFITTVYISKKSDWIENNYDEYIKTQCADIELCKSYIKIELLESEYIEKIKQIVNQNFDVIVYENPYSDWHQYLLAFNRFAPVQIVSNECRSTTFLPTIDFIMAPTIMNVDYTSTSTHFSEQVMLYLSSGFLYNIPNNTITLKREDIGFTDGNLLILYTGDYHTSPPGYDIFLKEILHVIPYAYIIMFKHGRTLYYETFYRRLKKNVEPYFHRIHFVNLFSEVLLMNYFSICDLYLETEFIPQPKNIILASNFKVPVIVIPQYGMKTTITANMLQAMNETKGVRTSVYNSVEYIISLVIRNNEKLRESKSQLEYSRYVLINDTIYLNEFISMLKIASGFQFNDTKNVTFSIIQNLIIQRRFDTLLYNTHRFITPLISDYEVWYHLATLYEMVKEYSTAYQCIEYCLRLNSIYLPAILEKDVVMKRLNGTDIGGKMEILNFDELDKLFNIDSL